MNELTTPSERHYRFHLRRMSLGLAFSVAMGAGMIVALIRGAATTSRTAASGQTNA
jgi:hypothetical protein